ncbi:MAG TPA: phage holin family protein [Candidatus Paceibacterota bacterium]|nr:phage holin family protein [Candidatus Paceibacterota bacterium]
MIKLISRIIILFVTNIIALALAAYFVNGFTVSSDIVTYLELAGVFTVLNILVRPILKLVLGPIILLTFGLGVIIVNALILYILYKIYPLGITIDFSAGLYPLVYATLIISAVHFVMGFFGKRAYKE